jgi:UDP-N-acetylglucosamine transferase subunit ALG13
MIFVTIGSSRYGFERLVKEMDEIAGRIDERVIMQIGETSYEPKNARYFRFASKEEMDGLHEDVRVIVCHAGVGSILTALEHNKPLIAVPRKKKDGEAIDDHQLEIARELEKEEVITVVDDVEELERVLRDGNAICSTFKAENILAKKLKVYLDQLKLKF